MLKSFTKNEISLKTRMDLYIFSVVKSGTKPSKADFKRFKANEELIKQYCQMFRLDLKMGLIDGKEVSFIEKEIARLKDNFKLLFSEIEREYLV